MRPAARPGQRGFTLFELLIAVILSAMGLATMLSFHNSTENMSQTSHVHLRAAAEHRRNLASLAHLFRSADAFTFDGFSPSGTATRPSFESVVGYQQGNRITAGPITVEWRASGLDVDGVSNPGDVWVVEPGGERVIARKVPKGGFLVRREGRNLAIRLTSYYVSSRPQMAEITSETSISLRN
ncbi:MAG: prepilin-type N-terminal cleavage/methylation domain-containing protein [Planctomycetota bacterium]|jgi:prepilin-type N-terminal cleavage/methylation domain-containing protein